MCSRASAVATGSCGPFGVESGELNDGGERFGMDTLRRVRVYRNGDAPERIPTENADAWERVPTGPTSSKPRRSVRFSLRWR
jgi:hypothetical protein